MRTRVLTAVAAALLAGCGAPPADGPRPAGVRVTAGTIDEVAAAVAAAQGKVVLVDFWATWCGPCVASFPHIVKLHEKHAAEGLACVSVSLDDEDAGGRVLEFLQERGATFQNLHWKEARTSRKQRLAAQEKFGFTGSLPYQVVFDRTGRRVWDNQSTAFASDAMLDELVRNLLAGR